MSWTPEERARLWAALKQALPWILWGTAALVSLGYAISRARRGSGHGLSGYGPTWTPFEAGRDAKQRALLSYSGYRRPQTGSGTAAPEHGAGQESPESSRAVADEIGDLREEVRDLRDAFDTFAAPRDRHGLCVVDGGLDE